MADQVLGLALQVDLQVVKAEVPMSLATGLLQEHPEGLRVVRTDSSSAEKSRDAMNRLRKHLPGSTLRNAPPGWASSH